MNNQQQLINFLRNLANDIENNNIEDENLLKISQFMMNFQFQNQQDEQSDDYSRDDMVKFLSLVPSAGRFAEYIPRQSVKKPSNSVATLS